MVLPWSMGNQLNNERAMIAQVRIWMNVNVSWAIYGLIASLLPCSAYENSKSGDSAHDLAARFTTAIAT